MIVNLSAWKRRSLFRQLLMVNCVIMMLSSIALFVLVMAGTLTMQKKRFAEENLVRLEDFASSIADEAVIGDDASIEKYFRGRISARDVFQITWIDHNQKIIRVSTRPESSLAPKWLITFMGMGIQENSRKLNFGGVYYGELQSSTTPVAIINSIWWTLLWGISGIVLLSVILLIATALVLQSNLAALKDLTLCTQGLADGDFTIRVPEVTQPEFVPIFKAFNGMAATIQQLIQRIQREKQFMQTMIDSIPDLIFFKDRESVYLGCNNAFAVKFAGKTKEQISSLTDIDFVHDHDLAELFRQQDRETMAAGHAVTSEDSITLVDGNNVLVETIKVPFYGESGEIAGLIGIARDITQRKRTEAALFEHQLQLQAMNLTLEQRVLDEVQKNRDKEQILLQQDKMASIGQLAAGVAHEINNPMGFLSSNLRTLTEYFDQLVEYDKIWQEKGLVELSPYLRDALAKSRESLEIDELLEDGVDLIKESLLGAKRVSKIVQDLKNFSRVDALLEHEPVDLSSCMESALNICHNELKYVANIQKNYAPMPEVLCNPGQLNQVFLNLLVNAGQALVPPGEIFLSSWQDDLFVYCAVRDTGSGMPDEVLKRIFDPFFTTKQVGTGTGLGLSISYEIIKQHNGELLVESTVGVGTTFTVKLPRQSESSQ